MKKFLIAILILCFKSILGQSFEIIESCEEARYSGIYILKFQDWHIEVECDADTDGGGWLVILTRRGGSHDFYQPWEVYVNEGVGTPETEYILPLKFLHAYLSSKKFELLEQMTEGAQQAWAHYGSFVIGSEAEKFALNKGEYDAASTNGGNHLLQGARFSTYDRDHDTYNRNCAYDLHSAGWFTACLHENPLGNYNDNRNSRGIVQKHWKGLTCSLDTFSWKVRRSVCSEGFGSKCKRCESPFQLPPNPVFQRVSCLYDCEMQGCQACAARFYPVCRKCEPGYSLKQDGTCSRKTGNGEPNIPSDPNNSEGSEHSPPEVGTGGQTPNENCNLTYIVNTDSAIQNIDIGIQ